mgnify:CR=1 FL=1
MRENKQWIEDVLKSTQGMRRAKPRPDLFVKIEEQIQGVEAKIIPFRRLQIAAAAAVLLMVLNITALSQYTNYIEGEEQELTEMEQSEQSLISNFNLYE